MINEPEVRVGRRETQRKVFGDRIEDAIRALFLWEHTRLACNASPTRTFGTVAEMIVEFSRIKPGAAKPATTIYKSLVRKLCLGTAPSHETLFQFLAPYLVCIITPYR